MRGATEEQLQGAYHGWLMRHGFVPRMRRCRPVIINVGTKEFLASECPQMLSGITSSNSSGFSVQEPDDPRVGTDCRSVSDSLTWMQHEVAFKGLPQQETGAG
jgi:hypothetical protein